MRSLLLVLLLIVAVIPAVNAAPSSVEVTIKLASTSAQTAPFRVLDCNVTPSVIQGNNQVVIVSMNSDYQYLIATTNLDVSLLTGQSNEVIETPCSNPTCPEVSLQYYTQTSSPGTSQLATLQNASSTAQSSGSLNDYSDPDPVLTTSDLELVGISVAITVCIVALFILSRGNGGD